MWVYLFIIATVPVALTGFTQCYRVLSNISRVLSSVTKDLFGFSQRSCSIAFNCIVLFSDPRLLPRVSKVVSVFVTGSIVFPGSTILSIVLTKVSRVSFAKRIPAFLKFSSALPMILSLFWFCQFL